MSACVERKLIDTTYGGEKRRWNFKKYVRLHVEQHSILEELVQHGYSGIDEGSKVRYLVRGVKMQALDTVKTSILGNSALQNDFTASAALLMYFIEQMKGQNPTDRDITIAATGPDDNNDDPTVNKKKIMPNMMVEQQYYSSKEFAWLTPEQRAGLNAKRDARDALDGGKERQDAKKQGKRNGRKGAVTLSKALIATVVAGMKGKSEESDDEDENDSDTKEELPMKPPAKKQKIVTNHNNPALQRNKKSGS